MTQSFAALKQNRQSNFAKLNEELAKASTSQQTNKEDERFWKPTVDKVGNGFAMIRFLSAPAGEDVPFVRIWDHAFKGPGGWYIENSLSTLGKDDPLGQYNQKLWNSGIESDKATVRLQKRRLHYISNILVIKDPGNPENEGKVFLFKYGKKIFDKLNEAMNPEFEDEEAINPFDLWTGANFRLKIRNVENYRNYDKSEFDKPSAVAETDEEIEAIWNKGFSLQHFLKAEFFRTYDELKKRLDKALGFQGGTTPTQVPQAKDIEPAKIESVIEKDDVPWDTTDKGGNDEDLEFFKNLVDGE